METSNGAGHQAGHLRHELLALIVDVCNIPDPVPEPVPAHAPLIGPDSPLGLDSLDAVEIVVAIQRRYGMRIDSQDHARKVLVSLESLAGFVGRGLARAG